VGPASACGHSPGSCTSRELKTPWWSCCKLKEGAAFEPSQDGHDQSGWNVGAWNSGEEAWNRRFFMHIGI